MRRRHVRATCALRPLLCLPPHPRPAAHAHRRSNARLIGRRKGRGRATLAMAAMVAMMASGCQSRHTGTTSDDTTPDTRQLEPCRGRHRTGARRQRCLGGSYGSSHHSAAGQARPNLVAVGRLDFPIPRLRSHHPNMVSGGEARQETARRYRSGRHRSRGVIHVEQRHTPRPSRRSRRCLSAPPCESTTRGARKMTQSRGSTSGIPALSQCLRTSKHLDSLVRRVPAAYAAVKRTDTLAQAVPTADSTRRDTARRDSVAALGSGLGSQSHPRV